MAGLDDRIRADLTGSMRAKDEIRTMTLRMARAALHARAIEKKGKGLDPALTDEETLAILQKEVKKRNEAADAFTAGNRPELALKEKQEAAILAAYLPAPATPAEIAEAVGAAIERTDPKSMKDFGGVVKEAMQALRGGADGAAVAAEVKRRFGERFA